MVEEESSGSGCSWSYRNFQRRIGKLNTLILAARAVAVALYPIAQFIISEMTCKGTTSTYEPFFPCLCEKGPSVLQRLHRHRHYGHSCFWDLVFVCRHCWQRLDLR